MKHFQKEKKYGTIEVNNLLDTKSYFGYEKFTYERPFDMSKHSSIGCGGCARIAFYPSSLQEMVELLSKFRKDSQQFLVVGNMTNVLPPDEGIEKAVVCTKKFSGAQADSQRSTNVFVEAGMASGAFLRFCRDTRKSGAEFLEGIPCTIGGALYMNAGVNGRYIAEIVDSVTVWRDGKVCILSNAECEYAYKNSVFMHNGDVILGATLRLRTTDIQTIDDEIKKYRDRRAHLPKGKSMGCVFKNPIGYSAGELIEKAGLKGMRIGGARVSDIHANFIINDGNASAKEIKNLITFIKNTVQAQYKIALEEEIRYLT